MRIVSGNTWKFWKNIFRDEQIFEETTAALFAIIFSIKFVRVLKGLMKMFRIFERRRNWTSSTNGKY